jgi:DNA-binding NtrC family response regulator
MVNLRVRRILTGGDAPGNSLGTRGEAMNRILLIEPEDDVRVLLSSILRESGFEVMTRSGREDCLAMLKDRCRDFSLLLLSFAGEEDQTANINYVKAAKRAAPTLPVIVLTGEDDEEFHDRVHKAGAVDVIERSAYAGKKIEISMKNILHLKETVEENLTLQQTVRKLKSNLKYYQEFFKARYEPVGKSESFQQVMKKAQDLAFIPRPVFIFGERGSGKELVAGAIHYMGDRAAAPFVTVNCAAFHDELLASELFGHEKGAFTGARRKKPGRFELADHGTLFLDEIGNMPLPFQEKILRIIEYQEYERIGGTESLKVDVRIIAATNQDIRTMIEQGRFRPDLYDRLAFETIHVPPLRDRVEDIEPLVESFAAKLIEEVPHITPKTFSPDALEKLRKYRWPGNIRELRNVVERVLCSSDGDTITSAHLPLEITPALGDDQTLPEKVAAFEKHLLLDALKASKYNQKKSAEKLGITYDQFRHLYKKHRLKDLLDEG